MGKKKILFASQEISPYLPETPMANVGLNLPKHSIEQGNETRVFLPKFGVIKEKTNNLHEVIRLSGMNLVIDDEDMPLIIKVASIPKERMQVYFIDNDEYFKRRGTLRDEKDKLFKDNDERMIFFTKGVIETVKKLNWSPDIIHVHGWMASLFPLYLKTYYKDEPVFENSKIVTSVYDKSFDESLNKKLVDKILFDEINEELIKGLKDPSYNNLMKNAIDFSDAIILGSQEIPAEVKNHLDSSKKPVLNYQTRETFSETYTEFYKNEVLNQ